MLKLMIVDDMEIIRREIRRFKFWGDDNFEIAQEAENGHEALKKLEECPVDMVITDIRMPKVDGIELLKKIMERKLCTCVVLVSDHSEFHYARQGLVLGAFDYIVKPLEEHALKEVLERAKTFILEKKKEEQRIEELEQNFAQNAREYISYRELLQLILQKDKRALLYAEKMLEELETDGEQDSIGLQRLVSNTLEQLLQDLMKSYEWLNKFLGVQEFKEFKLGKRRGAAEFKAGFLEAIRELGDLIHKLTAAENEVTSKVCSYAVAHVDEDISLGTVAERIFMNKTYVSETFKQKTGISFTEYITTVKMERAKKLMRDEGLKNYEIAQMLGFKDVEYFSKLFKKSIGLSPTEFRQNLYKYE